MRVAIPLLLACVLPLAAQSVSPIDKQCDQCQQKDQSTQGQIACLSAAEAAWDAELNKNYKALAKQLDVEGQKTLKAAQVAWIKYRDAEFAVIAAVRSNLDGSIYGQYAASRRTDIVKSRALELKEYLDWLSEGSGQ
jgi:uncharacterized protein YecT (DUF1311 family)